MKQIICSCQGRIQQSDISHFFPIFLHIENCILKTKDWKSESHLKSPSGSKGAWHQEGASGGNGP